MLDNDTKRRIDTARDILVGKVPDPKSQVEQITMALIYKFMDDMDKESLSFGGEASFFAGHYEKYGWTQLFDPRLSGVEMLNRYGEALVELNQNPNIPQLFRDIFKNAYLPYRDPETLKLFLKTINEFSYDHSERLGDAFEYLLSVLGSQGDAGQFRTPRHLIDFIVEILQPQKHETILDPACGTAGFLISAYKYIVAHNTKKSPGDLLTPDNRKKLMNQLVGYDISPDMVRLSLVNLYLHGFVAPKIHEYDTLTSEERWSEYADIVLANPPFMTPKGGIKPHKRFSIQATKSEVLFTDYIVEHIHPVNGRAAVIVPNGIVATTQNAYKQLRKLLINQGLFAVISLPSGIFQPYSGVKTSILVVDKRLAKQTSQLLFVKIENDGFDLGAQRRPIEKNDFPAALELIKNYQLAIKHQETLEGLPSFAQLVEKSAILENKDVSLSAERYLVNEKLGITNYEMVRLGEVVDILDNQRKPITKSDRKTGLYPYYGATGIVDYVGDFIFNERLVLVGEDGAKWNAGDKTAFIAEGKYWVNNHAHVLRPLTDKVIDTYLVETLNYMDLTPFVTGVTVPKLNQENLKSIQIPLPPLEVQREIVAKIEKFQAIINGAKQVVENYQPQIEINPEWEVVGLGEVCEIKRGRFSHRPRNEPRFFGGKYPFIQTGDVVRASGGIVGYTQTLNEEGLSVSKLFKPVIVLLTIAANIGDTAILNYEACFTDSVAGLIPLDLKNINPYFLELIMRTKKVHLNYLAPQMAQKNLSVEILKSVKIELPPLPEQEEIVARIEKEQALVNANKELMAIFEGKIKAEIAKVWGSD